jgi:hypothetical protein
MLFPIYVIPSLSAPLRINSAEESKQLAFQNGSYRQDFRPFGYAQGDVVGVESDISDVCVNAP